MHCVTAHVVVEKESEGFRTAELLRKVSELERLLGQKQVEVEFLNRVIAEGDNYYKCDLKKSFGHVCCNTVQAKVLNWFQMYISEFEFNMEDVYEYCVLRTRVLRKVQAKYKYCGISRQCHHTCTVYEVRGKAKKLACGKDLVRVEVLGLVRQARLSHPRMGSRPLYKMLNVSGMGINKFERLLSEEGLGIKRKRNRSKTTDGHLFKGKIKNLINGKVLDDINQLWVSDITYFQRGDKNFYIILIMDVYSRVIIGYGIYTDMFSDNNTCTVYEVRGILVLKASLRKRGIKNYGGALIHHSDKGSQFMSKAYRELLGKYGIVLSVAENSLQNAYAERLNGTRLEFFHTEDLSQLRRHLNRSVWLYNNQRPHSALKYTRTSYGVQV